VEHTELVHPDSPHDASVGMSRLLVHSQGDSPSCGRRNGLLRSSEELETERRSVSTLSPGQWAFRREDALRRYERTPLTSDPRCHSSEVPRRGAGVSESVALGAQHRQDFLGVVVVDLALKRKPPRHR
jgi:hypothetical protein